ncbi:metallophosphatase [Steroidobacter denitrificans]|uniref:Metallophosphatase n=1 Tax=Steroidobacter denitrificans TaxID=465721 RepID=A0A127FCU6_STEDE|nr:DNA repair exonuclease [Steroidobacter denitrificans]AMN47408.1 metallophosphatase [Steroidobacter denitrificans]
MLKLLHTADWQIGKLFGQFTPDVAALLAEARFETIERLAQLATQRGVDLVLVAGDVFDLQGVADRTLYRLFKAMTGFAGPWVVIPGNHDAALAESVWTRALRLKAIPDNVMPCLQPQPVLLESPGVAVLPAPLTQRHTYTDLTEWFAGAETPPGMLRIGLAHGCVQGLLAADIDAANPIAAGRAAQARLDYLALGDWHGARRIDERSWYAGTPETDRFRNNDSGHALLVELAAPGGVPQVEAVATGRYHWHSLEPVLQVPSDLTELVQRLAAFAANDVVNLSVSGRIDLEGHRRLHSAIEQARGTARGVLVDLTGLQLDPSVQDIESLQADGYLGLTIQELRAAQDGPNAALARDALVLLTGLLSDRRAAAARTRP